MVVLSALEARGSEETLSPGTLVKKDESIGCVEIRWQKRTHKVYFHKPKILEDLSADYLHDFLDIDGTSQEEKLGHTLRKVKALHIEAKHQQLLKQYGLSYLWARRRNISWFLFALAGTLNILLLIYYERDYYHNIIMPEPVVEAFSGLLFIQTRSLLWQTEKYALLYLSHIDNGHSNAASRPFSTLYPSCTLSCSPALSLPTALTWSFVWYFRWNSWFWMAQLNTY